MPIHKMIGKFSADFTCGSIEAGLLTGGAGFLGRFPQILLAAPLKH
mgnify:CR=1 FL=1